MPVGPDTVFELASLTKQFTAAAIMLLVEAGCVRLDDPLVGHIAYPVPAKWDGITVRLLLTRTAGLAAEEIGFAALAAGRVVKTSSPEQMWTPVRLSTGAVHPYGFGWEITEQRGHRQIPHGGITGTEYARFPDDGLTRSILVFGERVPHDGRARRRPAPA